MKTVTDQMGWEKWGEKEVLDVKNQVKKSIKEYVSYFKKIKLDANLDFQKVHGYSEEFSGDLTALVSPIGIIEYVHVDASLREVARIEQLIIDKDFNKLAYNEDIYKVYKYYFEKNFKKERKNLTAEEIKIVEDAMLGYKRIGMHLPKAKKDKLQKINNEMSKLSSLYNKDCAEYYKKGVWFTKEELLGVDENFIKSLKADEKSGKYFVSSTLTSHRLTVLSQCENEETRTKLELDFEKGANKKNLERLAQTLKLRQEKTKILGYKDFISYQTEEQIINNESKIRKFLNQVKVGLKDRTKIELKEIADSFNLELNMANIYFIENQLRLKKVNLDLKKVSEYFELDNTLKSLFKIWEEFFGLKTEFVREVPIFGDAKLYKFTDVKTGVDVATAIFDLHPRDGKYGHACVANLRKRYIKNVNGEKVLNLVNGILICNFAKNNTGPTLLNFNDLTTLYHEAGHMLHKILTKNNYASTGMSGVSTDFVEIPSQFLENFVTSKEGLQITSKHYKTGEILPEEIQKNIKYADHYLLAYHYTRQLTFGVFDMNVHGDKILDYAKKPSKIDHMYNKLFAESTGVTPVGFENFASHFAHIMGGYESKYYSYLVSLAYVHHVWIRLLQKV
jgi:Zn-dependent oligopeptidase